MMHTKHGLLLKSVLLLQTALYGVPLRCCVFKALTNWLGNHLFHGLEAFRLMIKTLDFCSCIGMGHDDYLHAQASEKCPQ